MAKALYEMHGNDYQFIDTLMIFRSQTFVYIKFVKSYKAFALYGRSSLEFKIDLDKDLQPKYHQFTNNHFHVFHHFPRRSQKVIHSNDNSYIPHAPSSSS